MVFQSVPRVCRADKGRIVNICAEDRVYKVHRMKGKSLLIVKRNQDQNSSLMVVFLKGTLVFY